jgi:hypothetical protein
MPWSIDFLGRSGLQVSELRLGTMMFGERYDLLTSPEFVGFANYARMFFHDPLFWKILRNTSTTRSSQCH